MRCLLWIQALWRPFEFSDICCWTLDARLNFQTFAVGQFSKKHSYQVLNSFGPSHALVWAAIRVAGWTDKSTMKDRGHLPDGSLPICHGKLTNVQDGQSGLLCNVSIPFSAQQKMKKESWLPKKIDCRMDLQGVPPLTQKSLTRFPLPRFLASVCVSGGF